MSLVAKTTLGGTIAYCIGMVIYVHRKQTEDKLVRIAVTFRTNSVDMSRTGAAFRIGDVQTKSWRFYSFGLVAFNPSFHII